MSERQRFMWFGALAGFCVVVAFGVGVIATAAFGSGAAIGASTEDGEQAGQNLSVELGDLFIKPGKLEATAGTLVIDVRNSGGTQHDFTVKGLGKTPLLDGGESYSLELDAKAGTYEFVCSVPGHADAGMKGTLTVTGDGDSSSGASGASGGMDHMSATEMAEHDASVTAKFPAETEGVGGVVLEPKVGSDGTKTFELTADEIDWEVEPGKSKEAWAYNGIVPGPTLRAELGDRVRIELTNELAEPTTMHLHGMTVPPDMDGVPGISQDAILPGETFTYEFTVRNTGSNMYHSHFDAQKQVPMGLLGAFIVPDPKDPNVALDRTIVLNDGPLGFTINGKGFPATAPLVANRGDLIRIRYMNEGLQMHPMHLHGMPQKVIANDGHLLKHAYWEDTVMVAPGDRIDVLVKATEVGTWAFHCHILNHAESEQGMFGMVTALVVQ